ncbi:MAG: class I SAM-dependent methyltransferase [Solobacterium sp.]|nr:class I SAM-dependent methyltransferase [Solobacterium sp.]
MKELNEIKEIAQKEHIPLMKDDGIQFLCSFIKERLSIMKILEAGTAVGYSALMMASLRENITIDTLEINEEMVKRARDNIKEEGMEDRIFVYHTDALLFESAKYYDLFFIDAAKSQYFRYLNHFYPMSYVGSYFIFDNINFHGIVEEPSLSHNRSTLQMTRKLKRFKERILKDERFKATFYSEIGDGILVLERIK